VLCSNNRQTLQKKGACEWEMQESWGDGRGAEDLGGESKGTGEFEAISIGNSLSDTLCWIVIAAFQSPCQLLVGQSVGE